MLVGFIVLCLCITALGNNARGGHSPLVVADAPVQQVKGRSTSDVVQSAAPAPLPDCSQVACLALTFDDGPDPRITPQVLDILARNQVPATFFLIGSEVSGREPIVRRMHQEGHEIGNHSWSHSNFTRLSPAEIYNQVSSTQAAIVAAGVPMPSLFRPPYGAVNPTARAHITMPIIRWDIDTQDWMSKNPTAISRHLLEDVHPGGIILMHDRYDATIEALEPALLALKEQYHFVTVSQLLGLSPGDQGQFFSRQP